MPNRKVTVERAALDPLAVQWGKTLRLIRKGRDLTQVQLAEKCHVPQGTVSRWETGERMPRDFNRMQLIEILDVEYEVLFPVRRSALARAAS